jgi:hypothetical protein
MNFINDNLKNNFNKLCKDIIVLIFSFSSKNNQLYLCNNKYIFSDLSNLRSVNKEFNKLIKDEFKIKLNKIHKEYWYKYSYKISKFIKKDILCNKCSNLTEKYKNNIKIILNHIENMDLIPFFLYESSMDDNTFYIHHDNFIYDAELNNEITVIYMKNIRFSHFCCGGKGAGFTLL